MTEPNHSKDIGKLEGQVEDLQKDFSGMKDDIRKIFDRLDDQGKELVKLSGQRKEIIQLMKVLIADQKGQREYNNVTRRAIDDAQARLEKFEKDGCGRSKECDESNDPTVSAFFKRAALKALEWAVVVALLICLAWIAQKFGIAFNDGSVKLPVMPSP